MCLREVNLKLNYDEKEKKYVGHGYKSMTIKKGDLGKWKEARGEGVLKSSQEYSTISGEYVPGFHIFLDLEDAKRYGNGPYYQVKFREVLAFGDNEAGWIGPTKQYGDCVVSRYIKYVMQVL